MYVHTRTRQLYRAYQEPPQPVCLVFAGEASSAQSSTTPASAGEPDSEGSGSKGEHEKKDRQVEVRWYDARARTALKKVALWLNVPWTKVATFECLAAEQAQVGCCLHASCMHVHPATC